MDIVDIVLAKALAGGGGGGSGLPEIRDEVTELLNKNLTFVDSGMGAYATQENVDFSLSVGSVYTVKWDNVDYTCTAAEIDSGGVMVTAIGNVSILGMTPDTGEPFMAFMPQAGVLAFFTPSTSASHDVVLSGMAQVPPNGYVLGIDGGEWKAVPSGGGGGDTPSGSGYAVPEVVFEYHVSGQSYEIVRPTYDELIEILGEQKTAPIVFTQKTIMNDQVSDYRSFSGYLETALTNVYINASQISFSVGANGDQITTLLYYYQIDNTDTIQETKIVQNSVSASPIS